VDINEDDAKELLDRFICPKCKTDVLFTTWKRMCRKAARVTSEPPSKYCSDEHARDFWDFVASKVRKDDAPSIGGALNQTEVRDLLAACKNVDDFHKLGRKPRLPKKEGADPGIIPLLYTPFRR
jgi:COMPASS component SPP1